jgi:hypothetical protein
MSVDLETLADLETALATARQIYQAAREALEGALGQIYDDPKSAADGLVSQAEEFGPDDALKNYKDRPHDFGSIRKADLVPWRDGELALSQALPELEDAQERIDQLSFRRDKLMDRSEGVRTINVQGEAFVLDGRNGSLRRDGPPHEVVRISEQAHRELSVSERFAKDAGIRKATPPPFDPSRPRGR